MRKLENIGFYGELALERLCDVLVFLDFGTRCFYTDEQKFRTLFGVNLNKNWAMGAILEQDRVNPDDWYALQMRLAKLGSESLTAVEIMEFRVRGASFDGEYFWVRCTVIPIEEPSKKKNADGIMVGGKYYVCFKNINNEKDKALALLDAIRRDANTDLFNKKHTQESVEKLLETTNRGAMFMIDIDDFKSINDRIGHLLGDSIILQVANKLKSLFGSGSVLGRVGGDEFVGYVPNIGQAEIIDTARLILATLSQITYGVDNKYSVSVSVGVSRFPLDDRTYSGLYSCADLAGYYSKINGKNTFSIYNKVTMDWNEMRYVEERNVSDPIYETSFIKYIFQLLNDSKNRDNALEQVMVLVAKKFNASRCFYCTYNNKKIKCEFDWFVNGDNDKMKDLLPRFESPEYLRKYQGDGIYYRSDISKATKDSVPFLNKAGIKSFLHCALLRANVVVGFIAFESQDIYSEIDFAMLGVISKMITEFILQSENNARLKSSNLMLNNILDSCNKIVYVIDSKTNKLLYFNSEFKNAYPMAKEGRKCYEILSKRDAACAECCFGGASEGVEARTCCNANSACSYNTNFTTTLEGENGQGQVLCVRDSLPKKIVDKTV